MRDPTKDVVAVLGLGFIGLPFTAALANVGFRAIGVDIDKARVEDLKKNILPFYEPGLAETLLKNQERIEYTDNYSYALSKAETIFVTVGTPLNENDEPDYSFLESSVREIGKNLRKGQLIVLKSTVIVGTTEDYVVPRLEKLSGLKAGEDFFVSFCPERTIEGLALHEIYTLPKIVGGINRESSLRTARIMEALGSKVSLISKPRSAEMCKLVDNLYRATNIAFANEVGLVCEKEGIDAHEVVSTVNHSYSRTKIFSPGLGADGPCLSKDPIIFNYSGKKNNISLPLIEGCILQNKASTLRLVSTIEEFLSEHKLEEINLALVGLAFKGYPETDDLRGSPAIKIIENLKSKNLNLKNLKVYDPNVRNFLNIPLSKSIGEAVQDANVVLFLTNHPTIMNLDFDKIFNNSKKPLLVVDSWGNLKNVKHAEGINYFKIGQGRLF